MKSIFILLLVSVSILLLASSSVNADLIRVAIEHPINNYVILLTLFSIVLISLILWACFSLLKKTDDKSDPAANDSDEDKNEKD